MEQTHIMLHCNSENMGIKENEKLTMNVGDSSSHFVWCVCVITHLLPVIAAQTKIKSQVLRSYLKEAEWQKTWTMTI